MMYSFTTTALIAASLLTTFTSAVPLHIEERADATCLLPAPEVANFDGLGGVPTSNLNPIPSPYKKLQYRGFSYASSLITLSGVRPQSGRSYAVTNILTQNIPPFGTSADLDALPAITTSNAITSFDLQSLYYGCAINGVQNVVGLPVSCDITITGYRGTPENPSTQICQRKLEFRPQGTSVNMNPSGVLNAGVGNGPGGCVGVGFVSVGVEVIGQLSPAARGVSVLFDDIRYGTRDCSIP